MNYLRMLVSFILFLISLLPAHAQDQLKDTITPSFRNCKSCVVLCEQSVNRIAILDLKTENIIWDWLPQKSTISSKHIPWFKYPSDAKVVYGGTCILMTASGGAVALIRIADSKVLFYAYAGGNTHSAELLPDGNIVTASSDGNCLKVFRTDTLQFPENVYSKSVLLPFGHNVVWDKKRKLIWTASLNKLKTFTYNFDCQKPDLLLKDSLNLPGTDAHDLFPVFGRDELWLTNTTDVFRFNVGKRKLERISSPYRDLKSVSSGNAESPVILIYPDSTTNGWWTDEISSFNKEVIFKQAGFKMYKARWFLENHFSYEPAKHIMTCKS